MRFYLNAPRINFLLFVSYFLFNFYASAQQKGTLYLSWGYNREAYSRSTLHLKNTVTDNYDFKVHKVYAHDKSNFEAIGPISALTIPQYNLHIGYWFKNKPNTGLELSWDHLKYVVSDNQFVRVTGNIRGRYINKDTLVDPNFMHVQHTNGNNYLMFNYMKRLPLWRNKTFELFWQNKLGAGVLYSFTISTVLGNYDPGYFKVQGYVIGANSGFQLNIFKYFFLQTDAQGAFAHYINSDLGADHVGKLNHVFLSGAMSLQFGFNVNIN